MPELIGSIIGGVIALFIFTIIPASLLLEQYNLAVCLAYASISVNLLSIYWSIKK